MKTLKDIKTNMQGTKTKMDEHEANFQKFGWTENDVVPNKTLAYMQGWYNALKWVTDK